VTTSVSSKGLTDLSPEEKRALLAQLLQEKAGESDSFPLAFGQQRLWFLDQLEPGNPVYTLPVAVRLEGSLNLAALERSINEVVRRHDALRTTFIAEDGQPFQVIAPNLTVAVPVVDLQQFTETEREAEVQRLAAQAAWLPFDLAHGPLVRVSLLRLSKEEHVLLVTMHHIISDGWSAGVLVRELVALYEAFSTGKPSPLPELPIQYSDYAVWQRQLLQGDALEAPLSYWKKQLADVPVLQLPTDRPRPAVQEFRGATHFFELPPALIEQFRALSRREGATLYMSLLAVFKVFLHRYTGQDDIVVGSPIADRQRPEIEGLIGFFANSLVRSRSCHSRSWSESCSLRGT
jgi:hypothetical protein